MKLSPFRLERYFAKYEFSAEFLLSSSDCESWSIQDILALEAGSKERFLEQRLGYTESKGHPDLRSEVAKIYTSLTPENVLIQSGAEEPIFLFMNALLGAGDEVIVHAPCYQALMEIPRGIGCKVIPWMALEELNWRLDLTELKTLITAKTKCIVINTPHNPTGYLMSRGDLTELAKLAQDRKITLLCDEVYRESEYAAEECLPGVCDLSETAVSIGVLSKTYGLAGIRIGWVASRNAKLIERIAELRDYTTICNSGPSEFLATIALRNRKILADRNLSIIQSNLGLLDQFFKTYSERFSWQRPQAGPIGFPRLKQGVAEQFCRSVVEEAGVMLLPGSVFENDAQKYEQNFRIGFGRKNLPEALSRFETYLKRS